MYQKDLDFLDLSLYGILVNDGTANYLNTTITFKRPDG